MQYYVANILNVFVFTCLLFGCDKPERTEPDDILFVRLEVRQDRDSKQAPVAAKDGWTVATGRPFLVIGGLVKSEGHKSLGGSCVVKIRSLRNDSFTNVDAGSGKIAVQADETGRYEVELDAPSKPGTYFLSVEYQGKILDEAIIRVLDESG